jgi:hypothetical protein
VVQGGATAASDGWLDSGGFEVRVVAGQSEAPEPATAARLAAGLAALKTRHGTAAGQR